jgi:hypothetical protein
VLVLALSLPVHFSKSNTTEKLDKVFNLSHYLSARR